MEETFWAIIVYAFVAGVLGVVGFATVRMFGGFHRPALTSSRLLDRRSETHRRRRRGCAEAALAYGRSRRGMSAWEVLAPEPQCSAPPAVAEPFALGNVRRFELSELTSAVGATLSPGTLVGIDAPRRVAHTAPGGEVPYDILLVACGAARSSVVEGALTFRSPADSGDISQVLDELVAGEVRRVAFVVPRGAVWSLPAYELALMTAAYVTARNLRTSGWRSSPPRTSHCSSSGVPRWRRGRAPGRARDRTSCRRARLRVRGRRAEALPRRHRRGGQGHRAAASLRAAHPRRAANRGGLRSGRSSRPRHGARRCPCRRHYDVSRQAGWHRDATGGRRSGDDRRARGRAGRAGALPAGVARVAPHGGVSRYLRHDISDEFDVVSAADTEPLVVAAAKIVGRYLAPPSRPACGARLDA